jgi:hypothetical protein
VLLVVVAVGSYYAARFLLEGWPHRRRRQGPATYTRPLGPDDDDEFLAQLARRPKGPEPQGPLGPDETG